MTLFPQSLEAAAGNARVVHGMTRIAMAEVVLHGAQVRPLVGKIVAARVPQHVRVDPLQARTLRRRRAPDIAPTIVSAAARARTGTATAADRCGWPDSA